MDMAANDAAELVWLNEKERIASFHCVDGYQRREFRSHDDLMDYLKGLLQRNFRFQ